MAPGVKAQEVANVAEAVTRGALSRQRGSAGRITVLTVKTEATMAEGKNGTLRVMLTHEQERLGGRC